MRQLPYSYIDTQVAHELSTQCPQSFLPASIVSHAAFPNGMAALRHMSSRPVLGASLQSSGIFTMCCQFYGSLQPSESSFQSMWMSGLSQCLTYYFSIGQTLSASDCPPTVVRSVIPCSVTCHYCTITQQPMSALSATCLFHVTLSLQRPTADRPYVQCCFCQSSGGVRPVFQCLYVSLVYNDIECLCSACFSVCC